MKKAAAASVIQSIDRFHAAKEQKTSLEVEQEEETKNPSALLLLRRLQLLLSTPTAGSSNC